MKEVLASSLAQYGVIARCATCRRPSDGLYDGHAYCRECLDQVRSLDRGWLELKRRREELAGEPEAAQLPAKPASRLANFAWACSAIAVLYYLIWETQQLLDRARPAVVWGR